MPTLRRNSEMSKNSEMSDNSQMSENEEISENSDMSGNEEMSEMRRKCPFCHDFHFIKFEELLNHIWQDHAQNLGPGLCTMCKKEVKFVRDHIKRKHLGIKDKKARCPYCLKRVPGLDKHLRGKRSLQCHICNVKVSKETCLQRHLNR